MIRALYIFVFTSSKETRDSEISMKATDFKNISISNLWVPVHWGKTPLHQSDSILKSPAEHPHFAANTLYVKSWQMQFITFKKTSALNKLASCWPCISPSPIAELDLPLCAANCNHLYSSVLSSSRICTNYFTPQLQYTNPETPCTIYSQYEPARHITQLGVISKLPRMHSIPSSVSLLKVLNNTGPNTDPQGHHWCLSGLWAVDHYSPDGKV